MAKPKKIFISHSGCKRRDIEFPSGKEITLTQQIPYITSDIEELNFIARVKFVGIKDLEDKDYKLLLTEPGMLPEVKRILGIEDAKPFVWKDGMEDEIKAILKERGYIMKKRKVKK